MATPDLDQTLALKAKMDDEITPQLKKIEREIKTMSEALRSLEASMGQTAQQVGASAERMAEKAGGSTGRLKKDLHETSDAFGQLGDTAQQSASQVGSALQDALYTKGTGERLHELDKELKALKSTFEGLASTNRTASMRARRMKGLGQDTINKRVIPAFQELHGVLDQYPDTLKDITKLEKERMDGMGGKLDGVADRVKNIGGFFDKVEIGVQNLLAGVLSGYSGMKGWELRKAQVAMGRIGGMGAFDALGDQASHIDIMTQAPMEVWGEAYETLTDISRESRDLFPSILEDIVNLSKGTGIATGQLAEFRVQLTEIANLSENQWIDLTEKIQSYAVNSRASVEEVASALDTASGKMLRFNREQREAYANSRMASTAAEANMGLQPGTSEDILERLMNDPGFVAQMYGLTGTDVYSRIQDPSQHHALLGDILAKGSSQIIDRNLNMANAVDRVQIQQQFALDPDMLSRVTQFRKDNNLTERQITELWNETQKPRGEQSELAQRFRDRVRDTAPEQAERFAALKEGLLGFQVGKQTINALESAMDPMLDLTANMARAMLNMDEKSGEFWSKGIAYYSMAMTVMPAIAQGLSKIPLIGGYLSDIATKGWTGLLTAAGVATGIGKLSKDQGPNEGAADYLANQFSKIKAGEEGNIGFTPENVRGITRDTLEKSLDKMSDPKSENYQPYWVRERIREEFNRAAAPAAIEEGQELYMAQLARAAMGEGEAPKGYIPGSELWRKDLENERIIRSLDKPDKSLLDIRFEKATEMADRAEYLAKKHDMKLVGDHEMWAVTLQGRLQEQEAAYNEQMGHGWNDRQRALYEQDAMSRMFKDKGLPGDFVPPGGAGAPGLREGDTYQQVLDRQLALLPEDQRSDAAQKFKEEIKLAGKDMTDLVSVDGGAKGVKSPEINAGVLNMGAKSWDEAIANSTSKTNEILSDMNDSNKELVKFLKGFRVNKKGELEWHGPATDEEAERAGAAASERPAWQMAGGTGTALSRPG